MNKFAMPLFAVVLSMVAVNSHGDTLNLSSRLKLTFDSPGALLHTRDTLLFKYDGWHFSHEVVDPRRMYRVIDLTGVEQLFIKSLFYVPLRSDLPPWLAVFAEEQAKMFGVDSKRIQKKMLGKGELIGSYNRTESKGVVFVFDDQDVHEFLILGSEKEYSKVVNGIEVR